MKMFLGDKYIRLQVRLDIASDDLDDATRGNIENLKTEAKNLIQTHRAEIDAVCQLLI